MKRDIICITLIVIVGKIFGFFREILLANYFGTGYIVDAYLMSITIPTILFGFLPALGVGFTPTYYSVREDERNRFTTNALITCILLAFVFAVCTFLLSDGVVEIIAPGFKDEIHILTVQYFRVTIWLIILNTPIQILISYLNCNGYFVYGNITNLALSSIQCIFVVVAAKLNIYLLPYGILVSYILQFAMLFVFSLLKGYRITCGKLLDKNLFSLYKLSLPIFLSNLLVDINGFVDKYFASFLIEGSISSLNYAYTIMSLFYYVFTSAVVTIYYPKISQMVELGNVEKVTNITNKTIDLMIIIFIPISFMAIFMAKDIIYIILQRGNFDAYSLNLTMVPYVIYIVPLVIISIRDFINKILYAFKDTKSNLIYGFVCILCNIIISAVLVRYIGHIGLAMGTSLSAIITFPLYVLKIKKLLPALSIRQNLLKGIKTMMASLPMICVFVVINQLLGETLYDNIMCVILKCLFSVMVVIPITILCMKLFRIEEIAELIELAHNKLHRRNK